MISAGAPSTAGTSGSGRGFHRRPAMFAWMKLSQHLLGDFHARLRGSGTLCCNKTIFGKLGRIFGGAIRAAVLINVWRGWVGDDGIGENTLARMECLGALARDWLGQVATRAWSWGVVREPVSFSGGKSLMGPDQVS